MESLESVSTYSAGATADAGALQLAEHGGQLRRASAAASIAGELVEQRRDAAASRRPRLVHEAGVQVADALLVGALGRRSAAAASVMMSRTCSSARSASDRNAPSVARSAGICVVGQPAAVDMTEQVVLGAGTSVDMAQVDARADSFYRHATIVTLTILM